MVSIGNLRNYKKSLLEMMASLPADTLEAFEKTSFHLMAKALGVESASEYESLIAQKREVLRNKDLSGLGKFGFQSDEFIASQIEWAAVFAEIAKIKGHEQAILILSDVANKTWPSLFDALFPSLDELSMQGDAFGAFKEWFKEMMAASKTLGIFDFETIEDNDHALQINCTWCAWNEAYQLLGVKDACVPVCRVDDTFFPDYCSKAGFAYKRSHTLAENGPFCDYRFEREYPFLKNTI